MNYRPFDMVRYANSLMSGWPEAIAEAGRPEEGAEKPALEKKTIMMKCVYPEPDDGVSYSWVKMNGE